MAQRTIWNTKLKGVVSLVIPDEYAPYTVDRPDEPIESCVPAKSVLARKVPAILPTIFTSKLVVEMRRKLKEMYEQG